jgi:hypothetical protein
MIWHARSRDVGAVDVRAHAAQPTQYADAPFTYQPDEDFSVRVVFLMNVPHVVREYFGPVSPDTVWQRDSVNGVLSLADETLSIFAKPGVQTQDVDDGPFVPGAVLRPDVHAVQPRFVSLCSGCREGDTYTPLFNTTTGTPADVLPLQQQAEIHLYQNGQELPSAGDPVFGVLPSFTLTPGPASYRLTQQYDVEDGLAQPQRVLTSWTYTSAGTSGSGQTPPGYYCLLQAAANDFTLPCRAEPQVLLRYQLGLGLDNRLPAPGASAISVTAYHQPAAGTVPPIRGLHLAFTVDGGAHWQNVHTVSRGDGQFAATLILPKLGQTTGLVGLRAEAWDSAGNRVVQTISNAFGLAGR